MFSNLLKILFLEASEKKPNPKTRKSTNLPKKKNFSPTLPLSYKYKSLTASAALRGVNSECVCHIAGLSLGMGYFQVRFPQIY